MKYFLQALREEPPDDFDIKTQKWAYDLSEVYIIIMALKVVFVVVFEVWNSHISPCHKL